MDKAVCLRITQRCKRPPDPDGIDAKAAIDGIVEAGLLRDDSSKEIAEVCFHSETSEMDETIIEIIWRPSDWDEIQRILK